LPNKDLDTINDLIYLIFLCLTPLSQYFSYIMATSFSGGRSQREPTTMGNQQVNLITCGC